MNKLFKTLTLFIVLILSLSLFVGCNDSKTEDQNKNGNVIRVVLSEIDDIVNYYGGGESIKESLYYYPGDEYVDIVGIDWYTSGKCEILNKYHSYDHIMSLGKPCAMTEFGPGSSLKVPRGAPVCEQEKLFSALDMLELYKSLLKRGLKISYVLTWTQGYGAIYSLGKAKEAMDDGFFYDLEKLNMLYN